MQQYTEARGVRNDRTQQSTIDAFRPGATAGVAAEADERQKLERLCRYIARPTVSTERLSLTSQGNIRYALKTPCRDGTTHVVFEPLDIMARLAALAPNPRVNVTRFHEVHPGISPVRGSLRLCKSTILPICHGVFASNNHLRAQVTPGKRGRRTSEEAGREVVTGHAAMIWAQRLKRVFKIDIETCTDCGGAVQIIACIEDPVVIKQILEHLERRVQQPLARTPLALASPDGVSNLKE